MALFPEPVSRDGSDCLRAPLIIVPRSEALLAQSQTMRPRHMQPVAAELASLRAELGLCQRIGSAIASIEFLADAGNVSVAAPIRSNPRESRREAASVHAAISGDTTFVFAARMTLASMHTSQAGFVLR